MTEQDSIKILNKMNSDLAKCYANTISQRSALSMAIAALEKQIPKKPTDITKVKDGDKYVGNIGKCPCCSDVIDEITIRCDCGQAIDWSE